MFWVQKHIRLQPRPRGCFLVTAEILDQIPEILTYDVGLALFFIRHTSASLTLNENADPDVRRDLETHLDHLVPENAGHYTHTSEGPDDMPAHIKTSLLGTGLTVPVSKGRLALGTWQGIYLCEHRNHGGPRNIVVTIFGERK